MVNVLELLNGVKVRDPTCCCLRTVFEVETKPFGV